MSSNTIFKKLSGVTRVFGSLQIPLDEEQVKKPYPKFARKAGGAIGYAFFTFIWNPIVYTFRFLHRHTNLTEWIIFSMVVGILIGNFAPEFGVQLKPLGTAFINMITTIETPLIFSTLVVGIAGHGDDVGKVGRLAVKSIIYFEVVTTFALAVGLIMANLLKPGSGVTLVGDVEVGAEYAEKQSGISWETELNLIVPKNFFVAAYENKILSIVFCAAMFSCAMMLADKKSKAVMLQVNHSLSMVMFKFVGLVMNYAPIGIGAGLAATVGTSGIEVLRNLGKLIGSLYAALVIFVLVILVPVMFMARVPILGFLRAIGQPWLIAFSSASSESALPKAMERMRQFGCPNSLTAFVIPCGYSFNLDGSTLYLALASIFAAQAGGMNLPIGTQLSIMGTLMLSSKGVAAIPRASLIVLAGTLSQYNLPEQAIPMIMGVDALMDMGRTSINVFGNCLGCCVMSRVEGSFRGEVWREEEAERRQEILDAAAAAEAKENGSINSGRSQVDEELKDIVVHNEKPTSSTQQNSHGIDFFENNASNTKH
ncbi:Sodium:dicarboxylate symporter family-domain-containing protein [Phycomyces nitens]|nr:Sodium:dicarboxylate symporter family-domain-containing protein [Phycomyces nitens]